MALTTDKPVVGITPKDASGTAVDLTAFPTALTGITWAVSDSNASIAPASDNLSAVVTPNPAAASTVVVTVSGTNVAGTVLSETLSVDFTVPVPVVVTLNPALQAPPAA
jgi:hypothetical protein